MVECQVLISYSRFVGTLRRDQRIYGGINEKRPAFKLLQPHDHVIHTQREEENRSVEGQKLTTAHTTNFIVSNDRGNVGEF